MTITTTARHCTLDPAEKRDAHERLERIGRFLRERERSALDIHLVVTGTKNGPEAEITLRVRKHELVAREDGSDARSAIEAAAEQIEHQMRRLKERALARRKGERVRATGDAPTAGATNDALDDVFDDQLDEA